MHNDLNAIACILTHNRIRGYRRDGNPPQESEKK